MPVAASGQRRSPLEWVCERCGCTQVHGCPGGCYWVRADLCSACAKEGESLYGLRLTPENVAQASKWLFNCGPAAVCAVLRLTPQELRPHLCDFEAKGYTNPTLMTDILGRLKVKYELVYRGDQPTFCGVLGVPPKRVALARIQWGGPWTRPGVPMRARYRKTHWVAMFPEASGTMVFDINALPYGGWITLKLWAVDLVPWLIKQCCPDGDGTWWATHILEVTP